MREKSYKTGKGDHLVVLIAGKHIYIAEVICSRHMHVKVEEEGHFSDLWPGDYVILGEATIRLQQNLYTGVDELLKFAKINKVGVFSGLDSIGADNGKLCPVSVSMIPA